MSEKRKVTIEVQAQVDQARAKLQQLEQAAQRAKASIQERFSGAGGTDVAAEMKARRELAAMNAEITKQNSELRRLEGQLERTRQKQKALNDEEKRGRELAKKDAAKDKGKPAPGAPPAVPVNPKEAAAKELAAAKERLAALEAETAKQEAKVADKKKKEAVQAAKDEAKAVEETKKAERKKYATEEERRAARNEASKRSREKKKQAAAAASDAPATAPAAEPPKKPPVPPKTTAAAAPDPEEEKRKAEKKRLIKEQEELMARERAKWEAETAEKKAAAERQRQEAERVAEQTRKQAEADKKRAAKNTAKDGPPGYHDPIPGNKAGLSQADIDKMMGKKPPKEKPADNTPAPPTDREERRKRELAELAKREEEHARRQKEAAQGAQQAQAKATDQIVQGEKRVQQAARETSQVRRMSAEEAHREQNKLADTYKKVAKEHPDIFGRKKGQSTLPEDVQADVKRIDARRKQRMAEIREEVSAGLIDERRARAEGARAAQEVVEGYREVMTKRADSGRALSPEQYQELVGRMPRVNFKAIEDDDYRQKVDALRGRYDEAMAPVRAAFDKNGPQLPPDLAQNYRKIGTEARRELIAGLTQAGGASRAADTMLEGIMGRMQARIAALRLSRDNGMLPGAQYTQAKIGAYRQGNAEIKGLISDFAAVGQGDNPAVLTRLTAAMKDTQSMAEKTAFSMHKLRSRIFDFLGVAAGAGFVVGIYMQLFNAMRQVGVAAEELVKMQGLEQGFQSLSVRLGEQAHTLLPELRKELKGTADDMQIMQSANRAMTLGAARSAQELKDLMFAARVLGKTQGMDAPTAIENLSMALGRGSSIRYDNIGLVYTAAQATRDYAKELGKEVDALKESEREQAFKTMGLKKAVEAAKEIGEASRTAADEIVEFSVSLRNLKRELIEGAFQGKTAAEVVELTNAMEEGTPKIERFLGMLGKAVDWSFATAIKEVKWMAGFMGDITGLNDLAGYMGPSGIPVLPANIVTKPKPAGAETEGDDDALKRLQSQISALLTLHKDLTDKGKDATLVVRGLRAAYSEVQERIGGLAGTTGKLRAEFEGLETSIRKSLSDVPFAHFMEQVGRAQQAMRNFRGSPADRQTLATQLRADLEMVNRMIGSGALTPENRTTAVSKREELRRDLVEGATRQQMEAAQAAQAYVQALVQANAPFSIIQGHLERMREATNGVREGMTAVVDLMDPAELQRVDAAIRGFEQTGREAAADHLTQQLQQAGQEYSANLALQMSNAEVAAELERIYARALELLRAQNDQHSAAAVKLKGVAAGARQVLDGDPRLPLEKSMANEILRMRRKSRDASIADLNEEFERRKKVVHDQVLLQKWYMGKLQEIEREAQAPIFSAITQGIQAVAAAMHDLGAEAKEVGEIVRELVDNLLTSFGNEAIAQGVEQLVRAAATAAAAKTASKGQETSQQVSGAATSAGTAALATGNVPAGLALVGAGLALNLLGGILGRGRDQEEREYRATLRALRQARQEEMVNFTIVLPDRPINPRDPEWQNALKDTMQAMAGTRRLGNVDFN